MSVSRIFAGMLVDRRFGQSKVENKWLLLLVDADVAGLQVAMYDTALVCHVQRLADLPKTVSSSRWPVGIFGAGPRLI